MLHERLTSEDGAVAIMYSILMLVFIGFVAIVLDIGALRADRRNTQLLADSSASSGASFLLEQFDGSPMKACTAAWEYFLLNAPEVDPTGPWDNPCDGTTSGGPSIDSWTCDTAPAYDPDADTGPWVVGQAGPYEAVIVWPVPDELIAGEGYSDLVDGEPCERLGVWVRRTRGFIFGGIFAEAATIGAPAVARAKFEEGNVLVAALVVLDPFHCNVLREQGGGNSGAIHVFESRKEVAGEPDEISPGIIAVDSDATGDCSNWPVIALNSTNTQIYAGVVDDDENGIADLDGSGRPLVRDGIIFSYAVQQGRRAAAYNETNVTDRRLAGGDTAPPLPGDPPIGGDRVTREPWLHRYECRDAVYDDVAGTHMEVGACTGDADEGVAVGSEYVTTLRDRIDGAQVVDIGPVGTPLLRYEDTDGDLYVIVNQGAGNRCDLTAYVSATDPNLFALPSGANWWFDCDLDVQSNTRLIIPDGNVVIQGDLTLQGALAINTTSAGTSTNGQDNWVYVDGDFAKNSGAALRLGNPSIASSSEEGGTFVLLGGPTGSSPGQLKMTGNSPVGSTHNVEGTRCDTLWVDPVPGASDLTWTPCHYTWVAPLNGEFEDLGLWSEYDNKTNRPHSMGGTVSNLITDGIYYMPNAKFDFGGSGEMGQQRAQFVAYRLLASGNGALKIRPDPDRSAKIKFVVPQLIR